MTDDHHDQTATQATLLVRAVAEILGTHTAPMRGKEGILLQLAAAAVEQPDKLVRTVLYLGGRGETLRGTVPRGWPGDEAPRAT